MVAGIKRLCAVAALLGVLLSLVSLASCTGAEGINPDGARGADAVAPSESEDRDLRILMLGCDRAASLTDSILLLSVTPQTGQVRILQLPRDTLHRARLQETQRGIQYARRGRHAGVSQPRARCADRLHGGLRSGCCPSGG